MWGCGPPLLEPLQPVEQDRVPDLLRLAKRVGWRAPVETDPPGRVRADLPDERVQFFRRALQRKRLLHDHRLAHRKPFQRLRRLVELPGLGVEVDAHEVELLAHLIRYEPRGQPLRLQAPVTSPTVTR